ncbi:helix-hairpin-helix domain-containing protein [Bacteroidia bacterium]|nr:helix-hairpin-helix domain-containing protein [Bacteroidia bacterium]
MTNDEIATILGNYGKLVALHGGNSFQVGAYQAASFNIKKKITTPLDSLSENELREIPQIGKSVVGKIVELNEKGSFDSYIEMLSKTPVGVVEMLNIRGLGPKKVKLIWEEMGIETVGELLDACRQNRLANTKGFGAKTQAQVMESIEFSLVSKDKIHWAKAHKMVMQVNAALDKMFSSEDYQWVGEYARKCQIVEGLELLINSSYKRVAKMNFGNIGLPLHEKEEDVFETFFNGEFPIIVRFSGNLVWDTYTYITPSEIQDELKLLHIPSATEEELFKRNDLSYIVPELREIENISWMKEAKNLIEYADFKGCVHNHTTYSDGMNTLTEMAEACIQNKWQYFGVSDHSQTASYAGGLKEADVLRQWNEIDQLNAGYTDFKIFKSIESDILSDGSLDYPEEILKGFDFVVASIHSNLKMDEEKAMMRLINAIENPYTRILGHLTGRLLLMRDGYPIDHTKIIDACAANNVVIELNAHPYRLDMDWRYIHQAIEKGVLISINPDAHVTTGLLDMQYGAHVARKGGLTAESCLNTKDVTSFEQWIRSK